MQMVKKSLLLLFVSGLIIGLGYVTVYGRENTHHGDVVSRRQNPQSDVPYIEQHEPIPATAESRLIKDTIEHGWWLRIEAGFKENRDREDWFNTALAEYFSNEPENHGWEEWEWGTPALGIELPVEKATIDASVHEPSPLSKLSPTSSELDIQKAYIAQGRYNERLGHFWVNGCDAKGFDYKRLRVSGNKAIVVVDIVWQCELVHTNPDGSQVTSTPLGGEQHIYSLKKYADGWRITDDSFIVIPGYEP